MDLQQYIERQVRASRAVQFASSDRLSLGQIIDQCKAIPLRAEGDEQRVFFDFEYARPTAFDSWRGSYDELALGFEFGGEITLSAFIEMAESASGAAFEGYKGGMYTMTRDTPVWVANYGNAGDTAVTGVYDDGWRVVLLTGYRPT